MTQIKGRLTYKKLVDWVNEQFIKMEINDYEAYHAERTYFRPYYYEGGACKIKVYFRHKDPEKDIKRKKIVSNDYFMCFYFLNEYQAHINFGCEMYLRFPHMSLGILTELEIELRKK